MGPQRLGVKILVTDELVGRHRLLIETEKKPPKRSAQVLMAPRIQNRSGPVRHAQRMKNNSITFIGYI
jgi:hypothetical protein